MSDLLAWSDRDAFAASAERRLFVSVIMTAIQDASGDVRALQHKPAAARAKEDALAWLRDGGEDFEATCHLANLDPAYVRVNALAHVAKAKCSGKPVPAATMNDVARMAKVSAMTVARVLDHHPAVADTTRQRVTDAIMACSYVRGLAVPRPGHGAH